MYRIIVNYCVRLCVSICMSIDVKIRLFDTASEAVYVQQNFQIQWGSKIFEKVKLFERSNY